jgi:multidrug efflux pump subunit AcrA (membrane-fusion protein)
LAPSKIPSMTRPFKRVVWTVAGIIAVGGISWFVWTSMKPTGPGVGFISGNGRIEATEIDIATILPGRLIEIFANEGDFVTAEQPLAKMQIDSLDAQKDEANSRYRQALAAVTSAETQVAVRGSDTVAASAVVGQRESELDLLQRHLARSEQLNLKDALTAQELDDDRANARTAEQALEAAKAQVTADNSAIDAAIAQVAGANSGVAAAQANSMPQFGIPAVLVMMPLQLLSGNVTPRESMPDFIQNLMLIAPTTHFVAIGQAILFRGAGFAVVWPSFVTLLLIGGAFFLIALNRFRRSISQMA